MHHEKDKQAGKTLLHSPSSIWKKLSSASFKLLSSQLFCISWVFRALGASERERPSASSCSISWWISHKTNETASSSFYIKNSFCPSLPLFDFETYFVFGEIHSSKLVSFGSELPRYTAWIYNIHNSCSTGSQTQFENLILKIHEM